MKKRISKIFLLVVVLTSCKPKMAGPVGDIFYDEFYFKLERYHVNGKETSIEVAPNFSYLSFTKRYDHADSAKFNFFDPKIDSIAAWEVTNVLFDVNKSFDRGYYIMKNNKGKFFRVVVYLIPATGNITNLEMGALMDGSYQEKNDTLNYLYYPVQKF